MTVRDILNVKGRKTLTIAPDRSLQDVAQKLVEFNCGSLVVCDGDRMLGIITERDILRASAAADKPLSQIPVRSRMTTDVVTASPSDELESLMGLMTERRVRHLPVLDDDRLAGMVSIGDVVKALHASLTMENHYLKAYIQS